MTRTSFNIKYCWILLALGLLSGGLTAAYVSLQLPYFQVQWGGPGVDLVPGIIYGFVIGAGLCWLTQCRPARFVLLTALYTVFLTIAWFSSVRLALTLYPNVTDNWVLTGLVAGAFGAVLVAASTALLFRFFRQWQPVLITIAVGGLAGMLLGLEPQDAAIRYILMPVWQGAVAASLGFGFARSR